MKNFLLFNVLIHLAYVKESFHKWQKQYFDLKPWTSITEFLTRYELINNINISLEDAMINRGFKKTIIRGLVTGIKLQI
jgi:hypothetical protein